MNLFHMITADECTAISNYIEDYAISSDHTPDYQARAPLSHVLRFWDKNKLELSKVFGNNLILTKHVMVNRPMDLIMEDFEYSFRSYGHKGNSFYTAIKSFIRRKSMEYDWDPPYWVSCLNKLISDETLASNIYSGQTVTIPGVDGRPEVRIDTGCKASKALGKVARALGISMADYEDFRLVHSECLNQKKLTGDLCLSIHPLDYMTMSDNLCDWSSCMSWQDWGDYRQGTVEMMNSPYVVMAYLRSTEDMRISDVAWSNKKWRQLYVVTPEILLGIRQYPYHSDELEGIVLKWLRELAQQNMGWGPYTENLSLIHNGSVNTIAELGISKRIYLYMNHMYNDLSRNNAYLSPAILKSEREFTLCLSGPTECMWCGDDYTQSSDDDFCSHMLSCSGCSRVFRCSECGETYYIDDSTVVDGMRLCEYCYEEYVTACPICEEHHHSGCLHSEIYLKHKGEVIGFSISICEECFDDSNKLQKLCGPIVDAVRPGSWYNYTVECVDRKSVV